MPTPQVSVSVVIPSIGSSYLVEAISSVLQQTIRPLEILVCLDGVQRPVSEELKSLLASSSIPIYWIELPHFGQPAQPRNVGVQLSKGDVVAFLDDDDYWAPKKLELQIPLLTKRIIGVAGNAYVQGTEPPTRYFNETRVLYRFKDFFRANPIINSSMIVRTDLLKKVGGIPTNPVARGFEDYLTWFRLASLGRIACVDEPVVFYRRANPKSLSAFLTQQKVNPNDIATRDTKIWMRRDFRSPLKYLQLLIFLWLRKINRCLRSLISR